MGQRLETSPTKGQPRKIILINGLPVQTLFHSCVFFPIFLQNPIQSLRKSVTQVVPAFAFQRKFFHSLFDTNLFTEARQCLQRHEFTLLWFHASRSANFIVKIQCGSQGSFPAPKQGKRSMGTRLTKIQTLRRPKCREMYGFPPHGFTELVGVLIPMLFN